MVIFLLQHANDEDDPQKDSVCFRTHCFLKPYYLGSVLTNEVLLNVCSDVLLMFWLVFNSERQPIPYANIGIMAT